jgi:hypothetical protein
VSACSASDADTSSSEVPAVTSQVEALPVTVATDDPDPSEQTAEAAAPVSSEEPLTSDLDSAGGVDGPVMYWRERPRGEDESEDSEIVGTLEREGDCLFLEVDGYRSTVVWEFGTRWDEARSLVQLPDGTEVQIGNKLPGRGGGEHSSDGLMVFTTSAAVIERVQVCAGSEGGVSVIQR